MKLASDEVTPSVDDGEEDDEGEGTTLYYDAEEGTLRDADGDEVRFEVGDSEEPEDQEENEEEDEEGEGSQTPQQEDQSQARAQTITSTSLATTNPRRPSRLRRISFATQRRVSLPLMLEHSR